ncbi:MAG TPA: plasmid pRiA4b ORF-3 family protein [Polyangiaceae bacterium]|nr:plasmid pRiA4b ORF-3 family protein [Polyangiaceae bacterium]
MCNCATSNPRSGERWRSRGARRSRSVHYALQLAMGWENSHLHMFTIGKRRYGPPDAVEGSRDLEDESAHLLQDVAKRGTSFLYRYDYGDSWEHDVEVQRVSPSAKPVVPRCLAGARACPPEDCGGAPGYAHLLAALADPKHDDHAEMLEWVPKGFDPERFRASAKDLTRNPAERSRPAEAAGGCSCGCCGDDPSTALPRALVESALDLSPIQRASLVAILAGSLADDVESAVDQLQEADRALAKKAKPALAAGSRRGKPAAKRSR